MNRCLILIFGILLIFSFCTIAQKENKRKYKEQYHTQNRQYNDKNKLLKKKDKITYLNIAYYNDSIFPNNFILEFKNLKELRIYSYIEAPSFNSLTYKKYKTVKFDTCKFQSISHIKTLGFYGFDFKQFPLELSNLPNIKTLTIHYSTIDSIPKEIVNFKFLTELDLWGNCIEYVDSSIAELDNLEKLDLSHNNLTNIPISIVNSVKIKKVLFANNYGLRGYNFNTIDFYNELEIYKLKMLLFHSEVFISVSNCKEANFVRERIDTEFREKLSIRPLDTYDCTDLDLFKK